MSVNSEVSVITALDVSLSRIIEFPNFPKRGTTPIDFDTLSRTLPFTRRQPIPPPHIAFEALSRISFPDVFEPLAIPAPPRPVLSPAAKALLEPSPSFIKAPWDEPPPAREPLQCVPTVTKPKKRRRWPKLFLAAVLGAVTGWGVFQTPVARNPHVRPYAEFVNAKTKQAWTVTRAGVVRGAAWTAAEWHANVTN
jgi:hypothetical protein